MYALWMPPNSTLELTSAAAEAANEIFLGVPEAGFTFQITSPAGGFGDLVLKPWSERQRTVFEVLPEVSRQVSQLPGVKLLPVLPPALPGGGQTAPNAGIA
jgi:multidrug efflux pump